MCVDPEFFSLIASLFTLMYNDSLLHLVSYFPSDMVIVTCFWYVHGFSSLITWFSRPGNMIPLVPVPLVLCKMMPLLLSHILQTIILTWSYITLLGSFCPILPLLLVVFPQSSLWTSWYVGFHIIGKLLLLFFWKFYCLPIMRS